MFFPESVLDRDRTYSQMICNLVRDRDTHTDTVTGLVLGLRSLFFFLPERFQVKVPRGVCV